MKAIRSTLYLLSVMILFSLCQAQIKPVYFFQKDDTLLKQQYCQEVFNKKKAILTTVGQEHKKDYIKIYDEQFEKITDLLKSPRTITASSIHLYLQSVLKSIISANDELKDLEIRVVFTRDWWPNAYSMSDGTIAINAGLFVFLNDEAELVFILCHELAHFYLNHSSKAIKKYVETINSDEYQKELRRLSKIKYGRNQQLEELVRSIAFSSRRHSRTHEAEADKKALHFMHNTMYDLASAKSVLQLLDKIDDIPLYAHLELQDVFSFTDYPFKQRWIEKETSIFSKLNEDDSPTHRREKDSLKTHPDCSLRISMLGDSTIYSNANRKKFYVDEKQFKQLKEDLIIEVTEECYREQNLSRNLYYSLLLLQAKKNLPFAIYSVVRCLNEIYIYQKNHQLGTKIDTESYTHPGDYNLLLRMLNRIKLEEVSNLAVHFSKKYQEFMQEYPSFNIEINKVLSLRR